LVKVEGADMQSTTAQFTRTQNTTDLAREQNATRVNLWLFMLAPVSFTITVLLIVYLRS
jgi:hypothetical protein